MGFVVVDVGNTSTGVCLWHNARVSRVAHFDGGGPEAVAHAGDLMNAGAEGIAYMSVVPSADRRWAAAARRLRVPFRQITWRDCPLAIDYPKPETIGMDRLADATGAVSRYGAPVIAMDFGTAFTAAAVTADGVWRGGVIAPGFPLMRDYLFERTAKLPRMTLGTGRVPKIGRSTEDAMRFGALVGYRGMVREIAVTLRRNFKTEFRLVATGGFARWVLGGFDLKVAVDPTLTLYGAGLIAAGKGFQP